MHTFVTAQCVCHNKFFVVTKIILVAALANDSSVQLFYQVWLSQPTCIFIFLSFYLSQILRIVFNIFLFVYLGCCLIIWNSAWWWSHPLSFTHSYHFWLSWSMVKITGEFVKQFDFCSFECGSTEQLLFGYIWGHHLIMLLTTHHILRKIR